MHCIAKSNSISPSNIFLIPRILLKNYTRNFSATKTSSNGKWNKFFTAGLHSILLFFIVLMDAVEPKWTKHADNFTLISFDRLGDRCFLVSSSLFHLLRGCRAGILSTIYCEIIILWFHKYKRRLVCFRCSGEIKNSIKIIHNWKTSVRIWRLTRQRKQIKCFFIHPRNSFEISFVSVVNANWRREVSQGILVMTGNEEFSHYTFIKGEFLKKKNSNRRIISTFSTALDTIMH